MFIEGLLEERLEIEEKKKQFSVILPANNGTKKTNFTLKLNIFFLYSLILFHSFTIKGNGVELILNSKQR